MNLKKSLIHEAMHLTPPDKFQLIELLVTSLDRPDHEIDNIWKDEAEHRLKAFRQGRTKGISAKQVLGQS